MIHILSVHRFDYAKNHTKSIIFIDGQFICFGMEPENKVNNQIPGQRDLIPEGKYQLVLSMSPKFKKLLPEVIDVPFNTGIRIHAGNHPSETSGCLLVGAYFADNMLLDSNKMLNKIIDKLIEFKANNEGVRIIYSAAEVDNFLIVKKY